MHAIRTPTRSSPVRSIAGWLLLTAALLLARPVSAQIPGAAGGQKPTAEQAQELLQTRPDLVQMLRQKFAASGLTPDQVRARLRAAGYPEHLLDPYLAGADTTQQVTPAPGTLNAIQGLGLLSPQELDSLQVVDSTRLANDSTRRVVDSLLTLRADSLRRDSLADSTRMPPGQLKVFGLDVFRRTSTQFQANQTGPVDDSYQLGPGDVLVLMLTGDVEQTHTLEVTRDGFVVMPQVGQMYVANLTLGQFRDMLYQRLSRVYSGIGRSAHARTHFEVTVAKLRNIQVYVVGDVIRPGAYQISGAGTVLTALYAAGGPTRNGSFRTVEVRRGSRLVDSLDLYDYLLHGDNPTGVRLQNGDVVFVPVHEARVKMAGAVVRPAIYGIKASETLRDALQFAGGFDATASRARVQIYRVLPPGSRTNNGQARVVIDVGADQFTDGVAPAVPLADGDSVTVFNVPKEVRSFITVSGDVWVPGTVGYSAGMHLSDAIRLAGGPQPDVYLGRILVTRMGEDSTRHQLRSAFTDSTGGVTDDLVLQDRDLVQVFARKDFAPERYISVTGAVQRPGRVAYREGMTLRDAVLLANGVVQGADLQEAEIARLDRTGPPGSLARTVRVPIDSSFLFDHVHQPTAAGSETVLMPYDNVLIMRRADWNLQRLVYLTGQVEHPGQYALTSMTERLSSVIQRAGGLTDQAYAGGIEFYRGQTTIGRAIAVGPSANTQGVTDTTTPEPHLIKDRIGIDLPQVLRDSSARDNIILANGDSIFIPEYESTIAVDGAVNAPGLVSFSPGKSIDWYIDAAGGYSQFGDRDHVYVIQPDGSRATVHRRFLLSDGVPEARAGARIYVPARIAPKQPSTLPSLLATAAQALTALVTLVVLVRK